MALGRVPAVEAGLEMAVDHIVEQRALSRAGHAGHRRQCAERNVDVHVSKVVEGGAAHPEPLGSGRASRARYGDSLFAGEVPAGQGVSGARDRPGVNHASAVLARSGSQLEHEVGLADRAEVVLDHEHGVARVAKPPEEREKPVGIARMEPDRGLIEHVERVNQARSERVGEGDALRFSARQSASLTLQGEISESDVPQELQSRLQLVEDELGDLPLERRER